MTFVTGNDLENVDRASPDTRFMDYKIHMEYPSNSRATGRKLGMGVAGGRGGDINCTYHASGKQQFPILNVCCVVSSPGLRAIQIVSLNRINGFEVPRRSGRRGRQLNSSPF